jgi:CelD/BcsL family acetyltransferase involved in cellulose biosynthesis
LGSLGLALLERRQRRRRRPADRRSAAARRRTGRTRLKTSIIDSDREFLSLRDAWTGLHGKTLLASVFSSWEWQHAWWQTYGKGQPLRIFVAADEGGEIQGILALYVQRIEVMGVSVRVARLVGTGGDTVPDDLGPVVRPGQEGEVGGALAEAILGAPREWDVLLLTDLDVQCALGDALRRSCARRRTPFTEQVPEDSFVAALPSSFDAYLKARPANTRQLIRRRRRQAAAEFAVSFSADGGERELDERFEQLADLHRRRWQAAGARHSFSSPEYMEFHRNVMKACRERGWLRLYGLEFDGRTAAMMYCFRFRNRIFFVQAGFDPEFARRAPGLVLMGYAIEHAIGEGNEAFDFLKGEYRYKRELSDQTRQTTGLTVFRRTVGGGAWWTRRHFLPRVKARIRRLRHPGASPREEEP